MDTETDETTKAIYGFKSEIENQRLLNIHKSMEKLFLSQ